MFKISRHNKNIYIYIIYIVKVSRSYVTFRYQVFFGENQEFQLARYLFIFYVRVCVLCFEIIKRE